MPYIAWIQEIFPEPQQPFTAAEITRRLQQLYSPCITGDMVYSAIRTLRDRPATADIVKPLDNRRPAYFNADAARLVARYITRTIEPSRLPTPAPEKTSTSSQLPANLEPTPPEKALAA